MKHAIILVLVTLLISCFTRKDSDYIILSGTVEDDSQYLLVGKDTLDIKNREFQDTILVSTQTYDYIQLESWQWPKLLYFSKNKNLHFDFSSSNKIHVNDLYNSLLLNIDSILITYTLKWDMDESLFRKALQAELDSNLHIIDTEFNKAEISALQIEDLKMIEKYKVAHRTANFISFQKRNGNVIDRNIYDIIGKIDLNNKRLEKQVNNRNFQYFYLLDKVDQEQLGSEYPFAAIDTINKYSKLPSIRKMIIASVVKSSFYDNSIDHVRLVNKYEDNFGKLQTGDHLLDLFDKIQNLAPGKQAPSFGTLENIHGEKKSLDDLKGQNLLITVWGTWCPYCKKELPHLKSLLAKYGDKLTSVAISLDKDKVKWKSYVNENNWSGIHLIDSGKKSTFRSNYVIGGTNVYFLVDKNGTILSERGLIPSSEDMETLIENL